MPSFPGRPAGTYRKRSRPGARPRDRTWAAGLLLACACWLAGCSAAPAVTPPVPASHTPGPTLVPYASATPGPLPSSTPRVQRSPTPLPSATPTPFRYTIAAGDTLIGIAFRFGIETEALLAANPGIDPRFLTIGDSLVIPLADSPDPSVLQPTPAAGAQTAAEPVCYPAADGSLWCFLLLENRGDLPLENLLADISIYDSELALLGSRTAHAALNLLPSGRRIPLMAWFPPPAAEYALATGALQSALALPEGDLRYLAADVDWEVDNLGDRADVSGSVSLLGERAASRIWISLAAYDQTGAVVAARRLELAGEFPPGAVLPFEGRVFSLAGAIDRVEVLVEARP